MIFNELINNNNYIEPGVKILENVIIGDNNKIYNGSIIYPNTMIGNNNIILNNNILGEYAVEAKENYKNKKFNGLEIGNNNYFHVNNIIFNGYYRKTLIGNNNKFLAENYISHDTHICNNVVLYPRVITGGITKLMDWSTMGMGAMLQQKCIVGSYSMLGMGSISSHNIFPFFIFFNQKYARFNNVKIPDDLKINNYETNIRNLIDDLKNNNCEKNLIDKYNLPQNISIHIYNFLNEIHINKI